MSDQVARDLAAFRGTYSHDVEISHTGVLVWVRAIAVGQIIRVPAHFHPFTSAPELTLDRWLAHRRAR